MVILIPESNAIDMRKSASLVFFVMTNPINNYTQKNQPREIPLGWFILS
ncbi:MAG: hypothetical protein PHP68_02995 [Oscillospiraceae bacterium]|nr:hypothetical protein [Oscillospiraceae bacterium]